MSVGATSPVWGGMKMIALSQQSAYVNVEATFVPHFWSELYTTVLSLATVMEGSGSPVTAIGRVHEHPT